VRDGLSLGFGVVVFGFGVVVFGFGVGVGVLVYLPTSVHNQRRKKKYRGKD
jgi:hypothetical protein